ncbi:Protein of unknown function [Pyronema omphalodes CBS 100304]|uniref:Uncharacterized protein n=1 Tax=Pyronema omphalodes (strain CBS 100304) TaxID=1076935 RepID=U4KXQ7_PYROM|nr:Protein of unknown function [Pyronema omphalodes CBS 100304]
MAFIPRLCATHVCSAQTRSVTLQITPVHCLHTSALR